MRSEPEKEGHRKNLLARVLVGMMAVVSACPFNIFSETLSSGCPGAIVTTLSLVSPAAAGDSVTEAPVRPVKPVRPERRHTSPISNLPDSFAVGQTQPAPVPAMTDSVAPAADSTAVATMEKKFTFNPDPTKAVWMSALFPGLGQLYNRRYWKLPIVVGAFMGLGYATNWNNTMLRDYTRAYSDIMDNDPSTKSYMDFFAPTVKEEDLDQRWLTDILRRRKNYYRRNRDLCIICMVGVYALAMIDAYVDASLSHFDISPDLSVDISPTLLPNESRKPGPPSVGLYWALNF